MELARMTSKGQLTVPASIRKKLGISTGDQLLFYERDGQIVLAPVTPASLADAQAAAARPPAAFWRRRCRQGPASARRSSPAARPRP